MSCVSGVSQPSVRGGYSSRISGSNGSTWTSVSGTAKHWDQDRLRTNQDYLQYVEDNNGVDRVWVDLGPESDFEMSQKAFENSEPLEGGHIYIYRPGGISFR